ncbi:MAG: hypothetical protein CL483_08165 [Acidobacteria bacterium]|nr:hypothetical protein [Acidobacteriota bacterium]
MKAFVIGTAGFVASHLAERLKAQKCDRRDTYADTMAAREALGFSPTVTLAEGIAAEYRWTVETGTAG